MKLHIGLEEGEKCNLNFVLVRDKEDQMDIHQVSLQKKTNKEIAEQIAHFLNENRSIEQLNVIDPTLQEKREKLFKLINQTALVHIHQDGKVIRKKKLLENWTSEFRNEVCLIKTGNYQGEFAYFEQCSDWDWKGLVLKVQKRSDSEIITLTDETIAFLQPSVQKKWLQKEDVVPNFLRLANEIAMKVSDTADDSEINQLIDENILSIEEKYGTIAIDCILFPTIGESKSALKKLIKKRARLFVEC